ncbi:MAG TPA: glycosyltransferase family 4 protein [bacterium]|jgi:glycosyltransferase involved in cell wall biosynthesis|nr:glycosyltransferase family 4 protein [bacterium]
MTFRLGLAGPITVSRLKPWLDKGQDLSLGYGGVPVTDLAECLLKLGWSLEIFTLDPLLGESKILRGPRLRIHVGTQRRRAKLRVLDHFLRERTWLRGRMAAADVDLVHAHWTYEYALAALDSGHRTLISAHDAPKRVLAFVPDFYRWMRLWMARRVVKRAKRMTFVSPYLEKEWREHMGYAGRSWMIPNMACLPGPEGGGGRRQGADFVCAANGWNALKNTATLLKAFSSFREKRPGATLALLGYGHEAGGRAEAWARAHGAAAGVEFKGALKRPALLGFVRTCRFYVLPSREEACPMAPLEAMALGLPVIGGQDIGGVPYVLGGGEAGLLADIESPESLEGAMSRVWEDGALRRRLVAAGRRAVRGDFSPRSVTLAYIRAYGEIVGRDLR